MCDFHMLDGRILHEADYGGWSNFPMKHLVYAIEFEGRRIGPDALFNLGRHAIKGFAGHWISMASLCTHNGDVKKAREIMMVMPELRIYVCCFDINTRRWIDYWDDLKRPSVPHLQNYNLSVHGIPA